MPNDEDEEGDALRRNFRPPARTRPRPKTKLTPERVKHARELAAFFAKVGHLNPKD